jgi:hypothetical protein
MKVGMIVGLGLGIASVSGCTHGVSETNVPLVPDAAAPTPLVPEAYTVLAAAVAPAPPPPAQNYVLPSSAPAPAPPPPTQIHLLAAQAPAPVITARAVPSPAGKSNQYHPYWMVEVH